jgi:hypothetical protein
MKHTALPTLAVLAFSGCNSGAPTTDSFITQYCSLYSTCCQEAGLPTDGRQCRLLFTAIEGVGTYDPNAGSMCLSGLRALPSDMFCSQMRSVSACNHVYKTPNSGTKAPGEPCMNDNDCAPSMDGQVKCAFGFAAMAETQTCQVQIVGKEGDSPCIGTIDGNITSSSGTGMPPARGYTCDLANNLLCDSMTMKCTRVQDVGGHCTFNSSLDNPCVKTAYCDVSKMQCAMRLSVGSMCQAGSNQCVEEAYCDSNSKMCTMSIADGSPCTSNEMCSSGNCVNSKCGRSGVGISDLQLICGRG